MKVKAENVGSCDYLTAGKEYELLNPLLGESGNYIGNIINDEGCPLIICTKGSSHIDGNDWQVLDQE